MGGQKRKGIRATSNHTGIGKGRVYLSACRWGRDSEEKGKHIALFREDRADVDMEDKEEVYQQRRRTIMRRWRGKRTRRWAER